MLGLTKLEVLLGMTAVRSLAFVAPAIIISIFAS